MITTYVVEGGVGKCIAFSSLIPKLVEKNNAKIRIFTPYPDVFANNPEVEWVLDQNTVNWNHQYIQESDEIVYVEPYKSNYIKGEQHLIEAYANLLGVTLDGTEQPKMYTDHLSENVKTAFKEAEISDKYMLVQFSGGQSPLGWENNAHYQSIDAGRNYHAFLAQKLIDMLYAEYPDTTIINFSLPNEPHYENTIKLQLPFAVWHEALKGAQGFISIDSSLQHLSASAGLTGVVLWGSTRFNQLGYKHNTNMNYYMKDTWDEKQFNAHNPMNLMVEPERVMEAYKAL